MNTKIKIAFLTVVIFGAGNSVAQDMGSNSTAPQMAADLHTRFSASFDHSIEVATYNSEPSFTETASAITVTADRGSETLVFPQSVVTCPEQLTPAQSASSASVDGKVLSTDENSISVQLMAQANSEGGQYVTCRRGGLLEFFSDQSFETESEALALARSKVEIPIEINEADGAVDLVIEQSSTGDQELTVEVVAPDGRTLKIDTLPPGTRINLSDEMIGGYTVFAEILATSVTASDALDNRGSADVTVSIQPHDDELPSLSGFDLEPEPEPLIHGGGIETVHRQVVAIQLEERQMCSGTIIGKRTVLTAAHCVYNFVNELGSLSVVVDLDSSNPAPANRWGVEAARYPEGRFNEHRYDDNILASDIALLYVDRDFQDPNTRQTQLIPHLQIHQSSHPWGEILLNRRLLKFVGYGFTDPRNQDGRGVRRSVRMGPVDLASLTFRNKASNRGTCKGDSGGPALLVGDNSTPQIVGIVSKGFSLPGPNGEATVCKQVGFNTRVDRYVSWINDHVDDVASAPYQL